MPEEREVNLIVIENFIMSMCVVFLRACMHVWTIFITQKFKCCML